MDPATQSPASDHALGERPERALDDVLETLERLLGLCLRTADRGLAERIVLDAVARLAGERGRAPAGRRLEEVEALLAVWRRVRAAREHAVERVPPALPGAAGQDRAERQLAHDLKNHLASLATTHEVLDVLADELNDDERDEYAGVVERECRRAGELLAGALADAEGAEGAPPADESLARTLDDVLRTEGVACRVAGVTLDARVEPEVDGVPLGASATDLGRVLRNLVANAREACAEAGGPRLVRVEAATDKSGRGGVVLTVTDDGPGIADEIRSRLFAEGATTRSSGGAVRGVGLSTVQAIVRRAGGAVRAANRPTGGACLQAWLPAC